jgi:membrane protease YdiL (CAAX protease family)
LSELVADPVTGPSGSLRRLRILGILFVSILAAAAPVAFSSLLYTPDGLSKHGVVTHLFVPLADVLIMLLIVLVARRTRVAGKVDLVWFRPGRLEAVAIVLLPAVALLLMLLAAMAMDALGVNVPTDRMFLPEGRSLTFFIALAIRIVVVAPILEELFWRGFIQRSLERVVGPLPALVGQAVFFAAVHLVPFGRFGPALAFGLVAGVWRWRRRTLVPIILAHVILNGLYCAGQWPHWQDYSKVRIVTDYVSQMAQAARPPDYDPNADARLSYERGFRAAVDMPEPLAAFRRGLPGDWSEEAFEQFRRWVAANGEALDYMARGAQKPYYWPLYAGDSAMLAGMPQAVGARHLAFALDTRIKLRAFDGEDDLLLADVATLCRFARHFEGRKVLSHQLLGVSIRTLAISTLRGILAEESLLPETLASLQQQFERYEDEDQAVLDFIQRMFTDEGNGQGRIPRVAITQWEGLPRPFLLLIDPMTPGQNPDLLALDRRQTTDCAEEFLTHIQVAAAKTPWELRNEPNSVQDTLDDLARQNAYVGLLGTACQGIIDLPWRARTDLAALVATLAVIRYETDRDEYPDSLTQLVDAGFLRRVPQDAYSNGPLVYKRTAGGFLLYSLGLDFDDDGGVASQWGLGEQGGDQVFWPVR